MPVHFIIKKFPPLQRNCCEQSGYRSLCTDEKSNYLRRRLFKTPHTKKPIFKSFRRYWFCNNCYTIFFLKPLKKYKILQRFPLQCPECNSEKITRNSNLVNASVNKKSVNELLQFPDENNIEVDYKIKKVRYHLGLSSNDVQKKLPDLIISLS